MSWADENGISMGIPDNQNIVSNRWMTKDGTSICISDMPDSHLYNAYKKFDDERLAREMLLRLFKKASEK
jgi:hypothetical protein